MQVHEADNGPAVAACPAPQQAPLVDHLETGLLLTKQSMNRSQAKSIQMTRPQLLMSWRASHIGYPYLRSHVHIEGRACKISTRFGIELGY